MASNSVAIAVAIVAGKFASAPRACCSSSVAPIADDRRRPRDLQRHAIRLVLMGLAFVIVSGSTPSMPPALTPLSHNLSRLLPALPRMDAFVSETHPPPARAAVRAIDPALIERVRSLRPDVLVVLGARVRRGKPGRHLLQRIATAYALYEALDERPSLLLTGGHGEALAMRAFLLARGVPENKLLIESRARSTIGNARYSMPLLRGPAHSVQIALLVTTAVLRRGRVFDDHAARALASFSRFDRGIRLAALSVNAEPFVSPRLYVGAAPRVRRHLRASR